MTVILGSVQSLFAKNIEDIKGKIDRYGVKIELNNSIWLLEVYLALPIGRDGWQRATSAKSTTVSCLSSLCKKITMCLLIGISDANLIKVVVIPSLNSDIYYLLFDELR